MKLIDASRGYSTRFRQLKDALGHIPGIEGLTVRLNPSTGAQTLVLNGKSVDIWPDASIAEIEQALNPIVPGIIPAIEYPAPRIREPKMTTIGEQLKAARAKLAEARNGASDAVAKSDDASRVVMGEVEKVLKEAEDLRAEVAELTNGGPA